MPEPYKRSRSLRRLQIKVPGGRTVLHYKERKLGKAKCGSCGGILTGVQRKRNLKCINCQKQRKDQKGHMEVICAADVRDL